MAVHFLLVDTKLRNADEDVQLMPRIAYMVPMQGFRPSTNPRPPGRGGLGRLGAATICLDQNENSIPCTDPNCTYGDCGASGPQQASGPLCLDSAQNQVACSDPGCTYGDCVAPGASPAVAAVGAPTGSTLTYIGQWPITLTQSADSILGAVKTAVQAYGLQVTGTNYQIGIVQTAPFAVQIQMLVTGSGFARPQDAGSIVDHAFYAATSKMPVSSQTVVAALPGAPSSTPGGVISEMPQAGTLTTWFEQNALWIGLAIAAIAIGPALIRKL